MSTRLPSEANPWKTAPSNVEIPGLPTQSKILPTPDVVPAEKAVEPEVELPTPDVQAEVVPEVSSHEVPDVATNVESEFRPEPDMGLDFAPEIETSSDADSGLEWEAPEVTKELPLIDVKEMSSAEPAGTNPADPHSHRDRLFDAAPDALDDLPEMPSAIDDVTDVIDTGEPKPAGSPVEMPVNSNLPVLRNGSKVSVLDETAAPQDTGIPEVSVKPRRMLPPPPARTIARRTMSALVEEAATDEFGQSLVASTDVFSEYAPVPSLADPGEVAPKGFIPPGSGPNARRTRTARQTGEARKPAVVETIAPGHEDLLAQLEAESPEAETEVEAGSPDQPEQKKAKKGWRFPFLSLFLLVTVCGGGAVAIWYGMPHHADLTASIRFDNLKLLSGHEREKFDQDQHRRLATDDFRQRAQQYYESAFNGRPGDGFLYRQAVGDLDWTQIAGSAHSEGDRFIFARTQSPDPSGDRQRFAALLRTFYNDAG
jgi:hypothetical protein